MAAAFGDRPTQPLSCDLSTVRQRHGPSTFRKSSADRSASKLRHRLRNVFHHCSYRQRDVAAGRSLPERPPKSLASAPNSASEWRVWQQHGNPLAEFPGGPAPRGTV